MKQNRKNNLNGKTVANFYISDRKAFIEFDDGTELTITPALETLVYDEEWGQYVDKLKLNVTVS